DRQDRARFHGDTVEQDGAGAALRRVTANVRTGQSELLANEVHQQLSWLDLTAVPRAVDGHRDSVQSRLTCLSLSHQKRASHRIMGVDQATSLDRSLPISEDPPVVREGEVVRQGIQGKASHLADLPPVWYRLPRQDLACI